MARDATAALVVTQGLATVSAEREDAEAQRSTREAELSAARKRLERLRQKNAIWTTVDIATNLRAERGASSMNSWRRRRLTIWG